MSRHQCLPIALARLTRYPFESIIRAIGHDGLGIDPATGQPKGFDVTEIMIAGYKFGYAMSIMPLKDLGLIWTMDHLERNIERCIVLGRLKDTETDHAMFFDGEFMVNDNDAICRDLDMEIEALLTGIPSVGG